MKQTVVIKVSLDGHKSSFFFFFFRKLDGQKARTKALKIAVSVSGVVSASLKGDERDQIEVKGDMIDTVKLTCLIRKKIGHADIIRVAEREKKNEPRLLQHDVTSYCYSYPGNSFYEARSTSQQPLDLLFEGSSCC